MKVFSVSACATVLFCGVVQAQNYATVDQPAGGVSTSISTGERVIHPAPILIQPAPILVQPATSVEVQAVQSVPVYEAYEPIEFDANAYQIATEPAPAPILLPDPVLYDGSVANVPTYTLPVDIIPQNEDFSRPLGAPETFAVIQDQAATGEVGFQAETETSRLLLALEDTHAERLAELNVRNLAQRTALLDQFEKDAADPAKVIGLAARMRKALSELEIAQNAMLEVEEAQFMAAKLKVLDAAPLRTE